MKYDIYAIEKFNHNFKMVYNYKIHFKGKIINLYIYEIKTGGGYSLEYLLNFFRNNNDREMHFYCIQAITKYMKKIRTDKIEQLLDFITK